MEHLNPGGSIKDRPASQMVQMAMDEGLLKSKPSLVEASSGNMGIGLSLVARQLDLPVTICMPDKMSTEKSDLIRLLGARCIRTPSDVSTSSPESNHGVAHRMVEESKDGSVIMLDQYSNDGNPISHEYGTAEEIIRAFSEIKREGIEQPVDMIVMGVGTGGTITGVAHRVKKLYPNIKVLPEIN